MAQGCCRPVSVFCHVLLCSLGDKTETRNNGQLQFMKLEDVTAMLNHTVVDLLKIDIEVSGGAMSPLMEPSTLFNPLLTFPCLFPPQGFEYEVMSGGPRALLPITCALQSRSHAYRVAMLSNCRHLCTAGLKFAESCSFPIQIAMEVHYCNMYSMTQLNRDRNHWDEMIWPMHELSLGEVALFFQHMADLGYGIVSREDNPVRGCFTNVA